MSLGYSHQIIKPLVRRHAADGAFYWLQHEASSNSPRLSLSDLGRYSELLDAHIEGVQVAGLTGWEVMLDALDRWKQPGEAFMCAYSALSRQDWDHLNILLGYVKTRPDELLRAIISAIAWLPQLDALCFITRWTTGGTDAIFQVAALRAFALIGKRRYPAEHSSSMPRDVLGEPLHSFLADENAHVRAAACRVASVYPADPQLDSILVFLLQDDDPAVRAQAAMALCRRYNMSVADPGLQHARLGAAEVLWQCVVSQIQQIQKLSGWYRKQGLRRLTGWVENLAWMVPRGHIQLPALLTFMPPRIALHFIAHHADPVHLPYVLAQMENEDTARFAGWVWSTMTGIELRTAGLTLPEPDQETSAALSDARLDADTGLPLPNYNAIRTYAVSSLQNGEPHLIGQLLTPVFALECLEKAPMAVRKIAASFILTCNRGLSIEIEGSASSQLDSLDILMDEISSYQAQQGQLPS